MKNEDLPIYWKRWRRRRVRAFLAGGLSRQLAWNAASGEAQARRRVAAVIGDDAARDASLQFAEAEQRLRFVLVGNKENLTREQCAALDQMNCPGNTEA